MIVIWSVYQEAVVAVKHLIMVCAKIIVSFCSNMPV